MKMNHCTEENFEFSANAPHDMVVDASLNRSFDTLYVMVEYSFRFYCWNGNGKINRLNRNLSNVHVDPSLDGGFRKTRRSCLPNRLSIDEYAKLVTGYECMRSCWAYDWLKTCFKNTCWQAQCPPPRSWRLNPKLECPRFMTVMNGFNHSLEYYKRTRNALQSVECSL